MQTTRLRSPAEIAADALAVRTVPDEALLSEREASEFLRRLGGRLLTPSSLAQYRVRHAEQLPFIKAGKFIRYRPADLRRFAFGGQA